jgi:hypothetical protein
MKFTLTYDGELPSSGNKSKKLREKWEIRKGFHYQLEELVSTHKDLKAALRSTVIPKAGSTFSVAQTHHSEMKDNEGITIGAEKEWGRNLFVSQHVGNRRFLPIVRESVALACTLDITFLRKEEPGSLILQGGDLDNRIKTLFDALRIPTERELVDDAAAPEMMYCLLESDALINACNIKTDRLLTKPNSSAHQVNLIIVVEVKVMRARMYNQVFLGD